MTHAGRSLFAFGIYMLGLGMVLLVAPNFLLGMFGFPPTAEVWIRVVGMLVLFLGIYDVGAALGNWAGFIAASVPIRFSVIAFFGGFVVLLGAPATLLLFGVVDAVFALWTWSALRRAPRLLPRSADEPGSNRRPDRT